VSTIRLRRCQTLLSSTDAKVVQLNIRPEKAVQIQTIGVTVAEDLMTNCGARKRENRVPW
jgi:hypothetical protein